jgi:glycosyl transferase family 2
MSRVCYFASEVKNFIVDGIFRVMTVVFVLFGGAAVLELAMEFVAGFWRVRKYIAPAVVVMLPFASGGLFMWRPSVASGLIVAASGYRVLNMLRVADGRMNEPYLRSAARLTGSALMFLQLVVLGAWLVDWRLAVSDRFWVVLLASAQLAVAILLASSTARRLKRTRPVAAKTHYSDRELPSLTVAIPARNEDEQLEDCLRSVLASDYPKLEVIVLDDCSQDKTSQIIRSFAHDGVRFVLGDEPRPNWLAKNQAYEQLAREASGEIILFCGVDVRFAPHSIRQLVTLLKSRQKSVVSLMPVNARPGLSIVQTMRSYWELALPRRLFNRPPIMSSCWLITAEQLKKSGGFAAVGRSIAPEAYFAREAITHDGYSFLRATDLLEVATVKTAPEQRATAIRTRYPQLHRRPELVLAVTAAELALLVAPFALAIVGLWGTFGALLEACSVIDCLILIIVYRAVTFTASPHNRWRVSPLFPLAVLIDVGLLHYSMWKYEFSEVIWKGRNVCLPVMRVEPHLPDQG